MVLARVTASAAALSATGNAVDHQPEFTAACRTPAADRAVPDGATGTAWTAIVVAFAARRSQAPPNAG
ncbi:hypothetical protein GCM10010372_29810 [Streptomyces tauricus]|nr:hypothetical protein GCM10010372_29810 [Streptomyces tauricus]